MPSRTITNDAQREELIRHIGFLNLDKPWVVTIEPPKQKRSLSQNALYHQWIDDARKNEALSGWDHDDLDDALKQKCGCPRSVYTDFDGTEKARYSTSKADKVPMAEYMDRVYRFLVGEYAVYLTIPEERGRR